jgi:hypothetical protein
MRLQVAATLFVVGTSACLPSKQDVATAQAIIEMSDAVNQINQNLSDLQSQIDSLRYEIGKRDTVIKQLANLAGVVIPP